MAEDLAQKDIACRGLPTTQLECCELAARVSVALGTVPDTDAGIRAAAVGLASGLFGPAFAAADDDQRQGWVDMCELSLREAST